MFKKFLSSTVMVALVVMTSGILNPGVAMAASIKTASDTLSRMIASTDSNHTIRFTTPTGIANGATVTLTFNNGTDTTGVAIGDVDVTVNAAEIVVVAGASPSTTQWGFVNTSSTLLTFTLGPSAAVSANGVIVIEIGTNATYDSVTGVNMITNGSAGTTTLTIAAGTDSGLITMVIGAPDLVTVSANVNQTMTFDLDVGAAAGENTVTAIPLGVLTSGSVTHSDGTIFSIWVDGGTNAAGGMNVTVNNVNGADGLASTSVPTDHLGSATGTMVAGTPNYGLCVETGGTLTGFAAASGTYNQGTCLTTAVPGNENEVVTLSTTPANILTAAAPFSGDAQIIVNAAIATNTPAHTDYADSVTFIATASY